MKERLIALLRQAQSHWDDYTDWGTGVTGTWEEFYADHLLKNNTIVLPCNIGDTVYEICNNTDACWRCPHYSVFYGMDEMCAKTNDYVMYPTVSDEPLCEKSAKISPVNIIRLDN